MAELRASAPTKSSQTDGALSMGGFAGLEALTHFDIRIGGSLCLDFVNTVGGRISNPDRVAGRDYADRVVRERLETYGDLLEWGVAGGAVGVAGAEALRRTAVLRRATASAVRRRAIVLREAIYRVFKSVIEGWPPSGADVAVLNRELAEARRHEQLVAMDGSFAWQWAHDAEPAAIADSAAETGPAAGGPTGQRGSGSLARVLWPVACSAAELLTSPGSRRVRQCGGDECGWLFVDDSRAGCRRWCDMRVCGNRAKVRRYRERQRR